MTGQLPPERRDGPAETVDEVHDQAPGGVRLRRLDRRQQLAGAVEGDRAANQPAASASMSAARAVPSTETNSPADNEEGSGRTRTCWPLRRSRSTTA
nr:hypothetical protein GCM10020093_074380 [Planobispora longispora]